MIYNDKIICVFGGSGFLGHYVIQELAKAGFRIKVATRMPECAYDVKPYGNVGQIAAYCLDYSKTDAIQQAVQGCYGVVNLVGALYENRKNRFSRIHADIAGMIADACQKENVQRLVHVSALGIDQSQSRYAKSKREGEKNILAAFPQASIVRPSIIFGSGDMFFNRFARLATMVPCLPLIGGGQTKFQPVYAGDVAQAIKTIMLGNSTYQGQVYELGGPEVLSFKDVYTRISQYINRSIHTVSLPWSVASLQAFFMGVLPKPPLTRDQVISLKTDSITSSASKSFKDLGIQPTSMDSILIRQLSPFKKGGRFANKKAHV